MTISSIDIQNFSEREKDFCLEKLISIFTTELNRFYLNSSDDKAELIKWLLEEHQNRKWVTIHTRQVMTRDIQKVLGDDLHRDFILGLTQRFISDCSVEGWDLYDRLVAWRVRSAAIFTNKKPVEDRLSFLNMEVFETLQVNADEYYAILSDNPWLLVYGLLLEYIHLWVDYQTYISGIIQFRAQRVADQE